MRDGPSIREYRPGDDEALMQVCLRTGDAGDDATGIFSNGDLVGTIWLLPYLRLAPELASVVAADGGQPVGYVLGAVDTTSFDLEAEERYWPRMRTRYPIDSFPDDTMDGLLVHLIHHPDRSEDPALLGGYPSHLHVDLLPEAQGRGFGRALIERLCGQLASQGSPGVHLGVSARNERAIAFYRHLGFTEWEPADDGINLTFVRQLT